VTLRGRGAFVALFGLLAVMALATYRAADPSWNTATGASAENLVGELRRHAGRRGHAVLGFAAWIAILIVIASGLRRLGDPSRRPPAAPCAAGRAVGALGVVALAGRARRAQPSGRLAARPGPRRLLGRHRAGRHRGLIDSVGLPARQARRRDHPAP
jgi:hypothetical protein